MTSGQTLSLVLGAEGRATSVSSGGAPLIVAGGGDGGQPNYLASGARMIEAEEPGGGLGPYPANGRAYVNWTTLHGDPPPEFACSVPSLIGRRPVAARRVLAQGHCTVGVIRRRRAGTWRLYRVRKQWPRAGVTLPAGAAVNFVLARRR